MKTNHNRGFQARPDANSRLEEQSMKAPFSDIKIPKGKRFQWNEQLELSGKNISTSIHPNGGTHSEEKCRRGAKRHINRIARRIENAATKRIADDEHSDQDT
ncbi:hypothetical protein D3C87_588290 [compost metagenome]